MDVSTFTMCVHTSLKSWLYQLNELGDGEGGLVGCNPFVTDHERDFACIPVTMESQLKISIVHTQSFTSTTTIATV